MTFLLNVLPPDSHQTPAKVASKQSDWRKELDAMFDNGATQGEIEGFVADLINLALSEFTFPRKFVRGDDDARAYWESYNQVIADMHRQRDEVKQRYGVEK